MADSSKLAQTGRGRQGWVMPFMPHISCRPVICLVVVAALCWPILAIAGDVATLQVLGFSEDGGRFGIVQFGTEDGSGRPYAVLELASSSGAWALERNRIGVVLDPRSNASQDTARAELLRVSKGLLQALRMPSVPQQPSKQEPALGRIELQDGRFLTMELRLQAINEPFCRAVEVQAFALEVVFRIDEQVVGGRSPGPPASECPIRFSIAHLQTMQAADGRSTVAAVIAYERYGFEGADLRFFAFMSDANQF